MACLNIEDLGTVRDKAFRARGKWFDLGLGLKVNPDTLASIRTKYRCDPEECYREMLTVWLKSSSKNKTWRALAEALRAEAVGYEELADEIITGAGYQLNEDRVESEQGEQAKSRKAQKRESSYCDRKPIKRSRVNNKPLPSTGTQQVVCNDRMVEPQDLQQQCEQLQSELQQTKRDYQKESERQNDNVQRLQAEAQDLQKQLVQQKSQASAIIKELETKNQRLQSELDQQMSSQQQLIAQAVQSTRQKVKELEKEVSTLKQQLETSRQSLERLLEQIISMNEKGIKESEKSLSEYKIQLNQLKKKGQATITAIDDDDFRIQCQEVHTIKELFTRDQCDVAVDGELIYIYHERNGLYSYCAKTKTLQQLNCSTTSTQCHKNCAFAVIDHKPTLIGGCVKDIHRYSHKDLNTLLSLTDQKLLKWEEIYPVMPTARSSATAVTTRDVVIVAGGETRHHGAINSIEIMDTVSKQWSAVCGLPFSAIKPQIIIFGEKVCFSGKCRADRKIGLDDTRSAICTLDSLLNSPNQTFAEQCAFTWSNIESVPFDDCTCASLSGRLLAFGGRESTYRKSEIFMYNSHSDSWVEVEKLPLLAFDLSIASINENLLLILGGTGRHYTSPYPLFIIKPLK